MNGWAVAGRWTRQAARAALVGSALLGGLAPAQAAPDPAADQPQLTLDPGGHMATIREVIFSPDGRQLYSVADDKTIRVWDVASGEPLRTMRGQIGAGSEGKLFAAALAPDGRRLAVGGWLPGTAEQRDSIRLLNPQTGAVERLLKGHTSVIQALAFSPDGRVLASASADQTARLWEASSGRPLHSLSGHTDQVFALAFSPDGERLATGSFDKTLRLWSVKEGRLLAEIKGTAPRWSAPPSPRTANTSSPAAGTRASVCGTDVVGPLSRNWRARMPM